MRLDAQPLLRSAGVNSAPSLACAACINQQGRGFVRRCSVAPIFVIRLLPPEGGSYEQEYSAGGGSYEPARVSSAIFRLGGSLQGSRRRQKRERGTPSGKRHVPGMTIIYGSGALGVAVAVPRTRTSRSSGPCQFWEGEHRTAQWPRG